MTTTAPGTPPASLSPLRLLAKAAGLFLLANLLFAAADPIPVLSRLSAYNLLFPGRPRLPYSEHPEKSYSLTTLNLEAMLASHKISGALKSAGEYRVVVIGDSSVWGSLLRPAETIDAQIEQCAPAAPGGKRVSVYNLGYPEPSLLKDILVLHYAMRYQPDLVVWFTVMESFAWQNQVAPLVQANLPLALSFVPGAESRLNIGGAADPAVALWNRTIVGQRRDLADLARLQLYGVMWAATGVDQYYPETYKHPANDQLADPSFLDLLPPVDPQAFAWDFLDAGARVAGGTPILFVNEPIFISTGLNHDVRYNNHHPRAIYDAWREYLNAQMNARRWKFLDAWDLISPKEFTNTAFHLTPGAESDLAASICRSLTDWWDEESD